MTNGLVQHITVEESASIQWVKVYILLSHFSLILSKGDNIYDFLFTSLDNIALPKQDLLEGKNLLLEEQILFFIRVIIPFEKGYKKEMTELLSLKVYSFNVTLLHSERSISIEFLLF